MSQATRAALVAEATARLSRVGIEDAGRDARLLARWAAGLDAAAFSARLTDPAVPAEAARFAAAVAARETRVPVSHITGIREFWGRGFRVTRDVLDPRPETETLVAAALNGPAPLRILDLGTGTGCLLLTLLAELPQARGTGTDISAAALTVAAGNARALGVADRAEFVIADWCAGLQGRFDLVVSNPPYIAESEFAGLAPEVRLHEPRAALTPVAGPGDGPGGGLDDGLDDGLGAYRRIAAGLGPLLAHPARLLLEIGPCQAASVAALLAAAGLTRVAVLKDMDGRDRVLAVESV